MAVGLQTQRDRRIHIIRILEAQTTVNGPPASYAGAGVDVGAILDDLEGVDAFPEMAGIVVYQPPASGTGVITATVKLWAGILGIGPSTDGYGKYVAAGTGVGTSAGILNGGNPFDEHEADLIGRLDLISVPALARKLYPQILAIGGSGTAINVDVIYKVRK